MYYFSNKERKRIGRPKAYVVFCLVFVFKMNLSALGNSVEQELKQEVFIEIDVFDDCIEKKVDADFSRNSWSSYLYL